jgi:hypothetical protein
VYSEGRRSFAVTLENYVYLFRKTKETVKAGLLARHFQSCWSFLSNFILLKRNMITVEGKHTMHDKK